MLRLRRDHVTELTRPEREAVVLRLLDELAETFPVDHALLGTEGSRAIVELALVRAAPHGFSTVGTVWRYLSLMLTLGSHFDEDPQLPWVDRTLKAEHADTHAKMDVLFEGAVNYVDQIAGANGARYLVALRRACAHDHTALAGYASAPPRDGVDALYRTVHPYKHAQLSLAIVDQSTALAAEASREHGLDSEVGHLLCATLSLLLGQGAWQDPAHAWLREAADIKGGPRPRCDAILAAARARLHNAEQLIEREALARTQGS